MKIKSAALFNGGGATLSLLIRGWIGTLDCRGVMLDPSVDPAEPADDQKRIYLLWHEYIPLPTTMRRHCNISMLLSRHQDAEVLASAVRHFGFGTVRGSAGHRRGRSRGGEAALRQLMRASRYTHLAFTPDGPRGPRRTMSNGPVYLASKLGMPLVAMGFGYDRPWRMPTWDRFAVPRPYSRARAVTSGAIHVPPNLDRDGLEHYRAYVERVMNHLCDEAEAWAESGTHRPGERPMRRRPLEGRYRHLDGVCRLRMPTVETPGEHRRAA